MIATGETHTVRALRGDRLRPGGSELEGVRRHRRRVHAPRRGRPAGRRPGKAKRELGWQPETNFEQLIRLMVGRRPGAARSVVAQALDPPAPADPRHGDADRRGQRGEDPRHGDADRRGQRGEDQRQERGGLPSERDDRERGSPRVLALLALTPPRSAPPRSEPPPGGRPAPAPARRRSPPRPTAAAVRKGHLGPGRRGRGHRRARPVRRRRRRAAASARPSRRRPQRWIRCAECSRPLDPPRGLGEGQHVVRAQPSPEDKHAGIEASQLVEAAAQAPDRAPEALGALGGAAGPPRRGGLRRGGGAGRGRGLRGLRGRRGDRGGGAGRGEMADAGAHAAMEGAGIAGSGIGSGGGTTVGTGGSCVRVVRANACAVPTTASTSPPRRTPNQRRTVGWGPYLMRCASKP